MIHRMPSVRALAFTVSLALAAPVSAGEVTVRIDGRVSAVVQSPTSGPFVGAVAGSPVSLNVGLALPFEAVTVPNNASYWRFDTTQSSLAIGGASAAMTPHRLDLSDNPTGDRLRLDASVGSMQVQCVLDDPSGAWLGSTDVLALLGTSSLAGLQVVTGYASGNGGSIEFEVRAITVSLATVGASVCPAPAPNSSGAFGALAAFGSDQVAEGSLSLRASSLPPGALGLFLCSRTPGPSTAPGFPYPLCLGGSIGRFMSLAQSADAGGAITAALDLGAFPQPAQSVAVQAGETWYFQMWHRDSGVGVPSSGLSEAVAVMFL